MRELDRILPSEMKTGSTWCGEELVLPYAEALAAVGFANEHGIAVLGLEAFEVQKDGLLTVAIADASAHTPFKGEWQAYVAALNRQAVRWLEDHRFGENHGYILTSASESEFA